MFGGVWRVVAFKAIHNMVVLWFCVSDDVSVCCRIQNNAIICFSGSCVLGGVFVC